MVIGIWCEQKIAPVPQKAQQQNPAITSVREVRILPEISRTDPSPAQQRISETNSLLERLMSVFVRRSFRLMLVPGAVFVRPEPWRFPLRVWFCFLLFLGPVKGGIWENRAAQRGTPKAAAGEDLFRDAHILKLQIEIPADGLASLRRSPRKYVAARIQEGATVYTNVAIHLKGGPGSYRSLQDLPALTLNFDRFADGQTFHGLKKIHLNNSVQDRSFLSEKISRELFDAAGVPAPRAGNALVALNGRELGMYVLVEGIDKQFLRRYFKDPGGNVYDGHSGSDVTHPLPTNAGENRGDATLLRSLALAAREPDLDHRLAALEKTLDLDRFLSFIALEAMLWHWDGYTMNRNNFRIFHDRATDRMVFFPQGLDQILSNPNGPIFTRTAGLVAVAVLEIPEGRRRYRERVAQLATNVFRVDVITNRIYEVSQKIASALSETDPQAAAAQMRRASQLCQRFLQRANSIQRQLSPAQAASPADFAVAYPKDWQTKIDQGDPRLTKEQDQEGNIRLRISSKDGCAASWRSRGILNSGQYSFEGNVRTQGVKLNPNDRRSGAGLRISGRDFGSKLSGTTDWTPIRFDFDVEGEQTEVELVCELRAAQGDVWFDLKSLRLRKR